MGSTKPKAMHTHSREPRINHFENSEQPMQPTGDEPLPEFVAVNQPTILD